METIIKKISRMFVIVCSVALALMMLQVTADVIGKYLFDEPIPGNATVVASYYMVAIVFLPLAWVEVRNEAIVVELLYSFSPKPIQQSMVAVSYGTTTLFYGLLAWLSWGPAMHAYEIGEFTSGTWDVVTWPSKFLLSIGLGLGCVVSILQLARILSGHGTLQAAPDDTPHSNEPV